LNFFPTQISDTLFQLFEMVEKSVDRCRDAGNVVFQIVLKYS